MQRSMRELPRLVARKSLRTARQIVQGIRPSPDVAEYVAGHEVAKLNLGCGPNLLPGWFNTDRDPVRGAHFLDASHPFAIDDKQFHYLFAEHMIEHLTFPVAEAMLAECHRVARPGARIRVATPDLDVICSLNRTDAPAHARSYSDWSIDTFVPDAPEPLPAFTINQVFRGWGHKFLYDEAALRLALERAGFTDVRRMPFGESDDPHLDGIEAHGVDSGDRQHIAFETLILEARRA